MSRKWMLRISVATLVAAGLVTTATVAGATANSDHIWAGEKLVPGAYQTSINGQYRLVQQADGNLVEYQRDKKGNYTDARWSTGTARNPGATTFLQKDGNLVVRKKNDANSPAIWSSKTATPKVSHLTVQNDGNVVVYTKSGEAIWASQGLKKSTGATTNDYPDKWKGLPDYSTDAWGQYTEYCTSFVAWRLHSRNHYELPRWQGNAKTWADHLGHWNYSPKVGAVAQLDTGKYGHVAWVAAVNGSQVLLEDYNWNLDKKYSAHWEPAGKFRYIHLNN